MKAISGLLVSASFATFALTGCGQQQVDSETFDASLSYIDIAFTEIPKRYDKLLKQIEEDLKPQSLPHEAKSVRKNLGDFKIILDVFAYALPKNGHRDQLEDVRNATDDGYEVVGAFKDEFDRLGVELSELDEETQVWSEGVRPEDLAYDIARVKKARKAALSWKEKFENEDFVKANHRYFTKKPNKLTIREKNELSRLFWGAVESVPSANATAGETVKTLVRDLIKVAQGNYVTATTIQDVTIEANEIVFHDFRKRVRSVTKIASFFDGIFDPAVEDHELTKYLEDVVDRYGSIHDKIVAHQIEETLGNHERAEQIKSEIAESWNQLLQWQAETNVSGKLAEYSNLVAP
ncbi:MAG: hypothetical protein AB7T49_16290 [Oligoflexales bacterium]